MKWSRLVRTRGAAPLVAAVLMQAPVTAAAQEVDENYVVHHLGPAAEEMQYAGVDGSGASSPTIIAIAQRWGIDPAYWVSVSEAEWLVRSEREDREGRSRLASLADPTGRYPSPLAVRFGVVQVGLTCGEAAQKSQAAARLSESLGRIAQLNGAGTGIVGALSSGASRFVAPMAFATMVVGFASAWASQLSTAYRNAPCVTGGQPWQSRPNILSASLSHGRSPGQHSSPGPRGWRCAAWPSGPTFRRPVLARPSASRPGSAPSSSL